MNPNPLAWQGGETADGRAAAGGAATRAFCARVRPHGKSADDRERAVEGAAALRLTCAPTETSTRHSQQSCFDYKFTFIPESRFPES